MADLTLHRRAMMNIYFLIICQLLSQVTLLVDVMYCGDSFAVGFGEITVTKKYPEDKEVTFRITIDNFNKRYCSKERKIVIDRTKQYPAYDGKQDEDICKIVPNLGSAEYIYKLLLTFNFGIVIYLILNIWFTAFAERVPKFFRCRSMHTFYPLTYIIGSICYFVVSQAFTLKEGFSIAPGVVIMIIIFVLAHISSFYNKLKLHEGEKAAEETKPLLTS